MTTLSLSSRNLYTIGWICALYIERAAAEAMLDGIHDPPRDFDQPRSDTNVYTWGNIGPRNIVIAALPSGEYGVASAATTAGNMLSSFPQVQFGLMVGIGAGIPDRGRDIRLGDIIVSQPTGTSGGVVQYDFVKALQGGNLQRIGSLDSPPRLLLNAVSSLQSQHARQPSRIPQILTKMIEGNPNMAHPDEQGLPSFTHQGFINDRLFKPTYPHSKGNKCDQCDRNEEVVRKIRRSTDPQIHYGVIASGNTLVKDAAKRTLLVEQTREDCICFEMEAAGLMNSFPCLVIRGVSDYADSHKNDNWQRYAAATASAYAKELIGHVPAQTIGTQINIGPAQRLDALERFMQRVEALEKSMSRVDVLEKSMSRVDVLEKSISRVDALEKSMPRVISGTVNTWVAGSDWEKTPVENGRRRWQKRVNFGQPFKETPLVTLAIRAIGAMPTGMCAVGTETVDKNGFIVRFWAENDAQIDKMAAVWFAIGR